MLLLTNQSGLSELVKLLLQKLLKKLTLALDNGLQTTLLKKLLKQSELFMVDLPVLATAQL